MSKDNKALLDKLREIKQKNRDDELEPVIDDAIELASEPDPKGGDDGDD